MIEQAKDLLGKLIAFRTVSSESNLPLICFCKDWLSRHGIESILLPSADGTKASLHATIGPIVPGGVVLSAHTDVVSARDQHWATDPWSLTSRNGRLYGRGTSDMLGFVAITLATVPMFVKASLSRPVHIALSYDEEVGCKGGRVLAEELRRTLPTPSAVIVGEPTENQVANGHKSYVELVTSIEGHAVHSSRPDLGASALTASARLVCFLDDIQQENAAATERHDHRFDPPFSTLHCGVLYAGNATTAVADQAWFTTDIRCIPEEDPHTYVERYRNEAANTEQYSLVSSGPKCRCKIDVVSDIPALGGVDGLPHEDRRGFQRRALSDSWGAD